MPRKTIEVDTVREIANRALQATSETHLVANLTPEQAYRMGVASVLESVLFRTDNYHGFRYQLAEHVPETGALRDGHDDTRRAYI